MRDNLVLFMAHISESNFLISFIFKVDSSFTSLLTLVAGPEGTALETWILERWSPDSSATPRQCVTRSWVKHMWMWDFGSCMNSCQQPGIKSCKAITESQSRRRTWESYTRVGKAGGHKVKSWDLLAWQDERFGNLQKRNPG